MTGEMTKAEEDPESRKKGIGSRVRGTGQRIQQTLAGSSQGLLDNIQRYAPERKNIPGKENGQEGTRCKRT